LRLLLDSTFLIDYLRDNADAVNRFEQFWIDADELLVNDVVVAEAWSGGREPDAARLRAVLEPIEFVQPGTEAARTAGQWRADARAHGRSLSLADALIAATADAMAAAVLTRNIRDFSMTPVRIETY
jgi:predicted nucleic acid-binding protein